MQALFKQLLLHYRTLIRRMREGVVYCFFRFLDDFLRKGFYVIAVNLELVGCIFELFFCFVQKRKQKFLVVLKRSLQNSKQVTEFRRFISSVKRNIRCNEAIQCISAWRMLGISNFFYKIFQSFEICLLISCCFWFKR